MGAALVDAARDLVVDEDAGEAADGTQLIAVYRRERRSTRNTTTDSRSTTNPNKKEQ